MPQRSGDDFFAALKLLPGIFPAPGDPAFEFYDSPVFPERPGAPAFEFCDSLLFPAPRRLNFLLIPLISPGALVLIPPNVQSVRVC